MSRTSHLPIFHMAREKPRVFWHVVGEIGLEYAVLLRKTGFAEVLHDDPLGAC
jgi:hypothetical protein